MTYTEYFLQFLYSLPNFFIYLMLGLSAFVENIFPPIPGDTITAFGAFLVGIGRLHFLGVYLSTTVGSLAGFLCLFGIGGYLGRRFFIERDFRFFRQRISSGPRPGFPDTVIFSSPSTDSFPA